MMHQPLQKENHYQNYQLTQEKIQKISEEIMIKIDRANIADIIAEFDSILLKVQYLDTIDTSQVKMMHTPIEWYPCQHTFLRSDNQFQTLSIDEVLQNAPTKNQQNFITIPDQTNLIHNNDNA